MVAAHPVLGVFGHPVQTLDGVRPVIDNVAAERHGVVVGLGAEHSLERGPVPVDVRENEKFHWRQFQRKVGLETGERPLDREK